MLQVPSIHMALLDFKKCWHPTVSKAAHNFSLETTHFLHTCITSLNRSTCGGTRTVMTTVHVLMFPHPHDEDYIHLGELASTISMWFRSHCEKGASEKTEGAWVTCAESWGCRLASDGVSNHLEYKLVKILDLNKTGILFDRQELRKVTACVPFLEQANNICFGVLDQLQPNKRRIQERERRRM